MSGLVKAKKYDWKDSNMALFGSDTEKQVKKESAESEPAWHGSGQEVGLKIWRINKFKVEDWPKEQYGEFFMGDSYILLNTYKDKDSDELLYDVHFWIGQESTQDEYGTAAYKTVELDTYHNDKPVQHRDVQNHESSLFKSYFKHMKLLKGGADTGFRKVKPTEYRPRLLRFQKTGRFVKMLEVSRSRSKMTSGDVFILDQGTRLYQWNGKECNKDEKFSAVQYMQIIDDERNGRVTKETLDEEDMSDSHPFYDLLDEEDDGEEEEEDEEWAPKLFKVSDEDGSLDRDFVKEGAITMEDFDSNDVMILDSGKEVTVWVGRGASDAEQKNGFSYAHAYLMETTHPLIPVTVVKEGQFSHTIPGVA